MSGKSCPMSRQSTSDHFSELKELAANTQDMIRAELEEVRRTRESEEIAMLEKVKTNPAKLLQTSTRILRTADVASPFLRRVASARSMRLTISMCCKVTRRTSVLKLVNVLESRLLYRQVLVSWLEPSQVAYSLGLDSLFRELTSCSKYVLYVVLVVVIFSLSVVFSHMFVSFVAPMSSCKRFCMYQYYLKRSNAGFTQLIHNLDYDGSNLNIGMVTLSLNVNSPPCSQRDSTSYVSGDAQLICHCQRCPNGTAREKPFGTG